MPKNAEFLGSSVEEALLFYVILFCYSESTEATEVYQPGNQHFQKSKAVAVKIFLSTQVALEMGLLTCLTFLKPSASLHVFQPGFIFYGNSKRKNAFVIMWHHYPVISTMFGPHSAVRFAMVCISIFAHHKWQVYDFGSLTIYFNLYSQCQESHWNLSISSVLIANPVNKHSCWVLDLIFLVLKKHS